MPFDCVLRISDTGEDVANWTDYRWVSDFLTPTDAWSFHLGIEDRTDIPGILKSTRPGTPVELALVDADETKEFRLASGIVDSVQIESSRHGTDITIAGRDAMARAIDSMLDPSKFSFKPEQSLLHIITTVMKPFDLTVIDTGDGGEADFKGAQTRGARVSKRGKTAKKSLLSEQLKVQKHEGAYAFCARLAKRCGLHLWPGSDGTTVYLGKPDFTQEPKFTIRVSNDEEMDPAEVPLKSSAKFDATDQPSAIIISGRSTSVKSGAAKKPVTPPPTPSTPTACGQPRPAAPTNMVTTIHTVAMVNELVAFDGDTLVVDVDGIKKQYPAATMLPTRSGAFDNSHLMPLRFAKPIFLSDDESHNGEQVENVVRREMANRQRRALDVRYIMAGHMQNNIPWAVDTIVDVEDDILGIHERMYVFGVSYSKTRQSGTSTELHLVRPYTLDF